MKALSIRQPWASLIISGAKDIENRTWSTTHRGPLLIHASKRVDIDADTRGLLTRAEIDALPRGGIIGAVMVIDCVTSSPSVWFTGPIGWRLEDPRALPFIAYRGQLGLFEIAPQEPALRAIRARHPFPLFR